MRLPGVENAVVDPKKIREYLLAATHPLGRFKASFFLALGYTSSNWDVLVSDLRSLAERQEAELAGMNDYGQKYLVRGILKGTRAVDSSGLRDISMTTVWHILSDARCLFRWAELRCSRFLVMSRLSRLSGTRD